jgi:hypothetical protein
LCVIELRGVDVVSVDRLLLVVENEIQLFFCYFKTAKKRFFAVRRFFCKVFLTGREKKVWHFTEGRDITVGFCNVFFTEQKQNKNTFFTQKSFLHK